jgi:hypothetical protein
MEANESPVVRQNYSPLMPEMREQLSESELKTVQMASIAGSVYAKEITTNEFQVWKQLLKGSPPDVIEQAFVHFVGDPGSLFFPKPGEIVSRIQVIMRERRAQREQVEYDRELMERKRQRLLGNVEYGEAEVLSAVRGGQAKAIEKRTAEARERIERQWDSQMRTQQVILCYQFLKQLRDGMRNEIVPEKRVDS